MNSNEILKQYNMVFDENGDVKACGRYTCMGLIERLNSVRDGLSDLDFGDVETGMMNVENIKKAIKHLE